MAILSLCCNAKVKVVGRTTLYYACTKCNQSCNYRVIVRQTWKRSPAEQVQVNKKKYNRKDLKNKLRKDINEV